jgi:hypothetical protein
MKGNSSVKLAKAFPTGGAKRLPIFADTTIKLLAVAE